MGKIIRRVIAILLCATAVILAVLPAGDAEATSVHGDYEYDGATVARYLGSDVEVTLPAWVNRVGKEAFEGYDKMKKLVIPDSVTTVDFGAFSNCKNLATVKMSESVRTLGSSAFSGCTSLYSVSVPSKVRTIGSGVFAGCPSLSNVAVSAGNENYTSYDGVIYTSDGKKLVQYLAGRPSTTYQMPTAVREIEEYAFWGANNLSKLSITSGVKAIPEYAFSNCKGLQRVTLPRSVQSIFAYAFESCESLSYINIPDTVGYIDNRAFANTKGAKLRFIDANGNVVKTFNSEDVESYGSGTSGGTLIDRPDYSSENIDASGEGSGGEGSGGEGSEEFDPTKVTPLDEGETADTTVSTGPVNIAGTAGTEGEGASGNGAGGGLSTSADSLYNNGYYKASDSGSMPWDTQIEYHDYEDNMTQYDLGGGVVLGGTAVIRMSSKVPVRGFDFGNAEYEDYYGDSAATTPEKTDSDVIGDIYASYTGDASEVSVPAGVKAIGNRAFYKNGNLNTVNLPSGVTDIGEFAFARSAVSDVKLPNGTKRIDYAAFYNCPNLSYIDIPESVSYIALGAFDGTPYLENWKRSSEGDDFLIAGDNVLISYRGNDKEVVIPDGVKHIAAGAFAQKSNLRKAVIPGSVEDIGEEAFNGCSDLDELILNEGVKYIYDRAFKNSALSVVNIPDSVESVGLSSFDNGGILKTVIFNGNNVPNVTYNKSATRLSAKDLRTDAFEGAENAIVSSTCDLDDGTMFNPQFYGFDGEVYSISQDDDRMLVLERAISQPDGAGNVMINQNVNIAGLNYTLGQVKSDAFDYYKNWQEYFDTEPTNIEVNGEQGESLVELLNSINTTVLSQQMEDEDDAAEQTEGADIKVYLNGNRFAGKGDASASIPGDSDRYMLSISEDPEASDRINAAFLHGRISCSEGSYVPLSLDLYDKSGTVPIHKLGNSKMEVTMPVPSGFEGDDGVTAGCLDENGALETLSSELIDTGSGKSIKFVTGHCSTFVIYSRTVSSPAYEGSDGDQTEFMDDEGAAGAFGMSGTWQSLNKKVYGPVSAKWFIIVILMAVAGILVLYRPSRRKDK